MIMSISTFIRISYWAQLLVRQFTRYRVPNKIAAGGTDICSLFAGMCSALPVYRGEIQCRMLGMAIESFTSEGKVSGSQTPGELVCLRPFPCMPAGFWPLPGFGPAESVEAAKERYRQAYFAEFDGVWCMPRFFLWPLVAYRSRH